MSDELDEARKRIRTLEAAMRQERIRHAQQGYGWQTEQKGLRQQLAKARKECAQAKALLSRATKGLEQNS